MVALIFIGATMGGVGGAVVIIIGLAKTLDAVGEIYFGVFQRASDMRAIAVSLIGNGLLTAGLSGLLLQATHDLAIACCGSVVASALWSVGYVTVKARRGLSGKRDRNRTGPTWAKRSAALLWSALPLGLASSVNSVTAGIPKYSLGYFANLRELGIFSAISYLPAVLTVAIGAIAQNLLPGMVRINQEHGRQRLRRFVRQLLLLTAAFAVALSLTSYVVGSSVLQLAYGTEYSANVGALVILVFATVVGAGGFALDAALSTQRSFRSQLVANLTALLICGLTSIALVPNFGITGAAAAAATATIVQTLIKSMVFFKKLDAAAPNTTALEKGATA